MTQLHPDSAIIDALGSVELRREFSISRQAIYYWRRAGIPWYDRKRVLAMARKAGIDVSHVKETRGRRPGRPPTSDRKSASSALPA